MFAELFESTTAGGRQPKAGPLVLLGLCITLPAQSHTTSGLDEPKAWLHLEATNAGPRLGRSETIIARIRWLSGLTWEQLAELCSTSRRTLHLWASGRRMHAVNEERMLRILGVLERVDMGSAERNRRQLLEVRPDGSRLLELIAAGRFDSVVDVVEGMDPWSSAVAEAAPRPLPALRRPPAPVDLLDALHDSVHVEPTLAKPPKFRRLRRGR